MIENGTGTRVEEGTKFEDVEKWSDIRGIGGANDPQVQFQRCMQELTEIHDAICNNDTEEAKDAIGDTIVTLINLCKLFPFNAQEALDSAFGVIKYRKGITTPRGDFVRYGKLSDEDKKWCDEAQGNPGSEYILPEDLDKMTPTDFYKA